MDMEISVVRNRNGVGGDNGQPKDEKQQHQTKYTENRDQSLLLFTLITMECTLLLYISRTQMREGCKFCFAARLG